MHWASVRGHIHEQPVRIPWRTAPASGNMSRSLLWLLVKGRGKVHHSCKLSEGSRVQCSGLGVRISGSGFKTLGFGSSFKVFGASFTFSRFKVRGQRLFFVGYLR